jgi:hypothetical protein
VLTSPAPLQVSGGAGGAGVSLAGGGGMVGTVRYCVLDRGVTLGLSGVNPVHRHVVAQQSRFKSCLSPANFKYFM